MSVCLLLSVQFSSKMKSDQARVSKLLTDTVTLLCKNGLVYSQEIKVQGLLGITLDKNEVFLVDINEVIGGNVGVSSGKHSSTVAPTEPLRKKNTVASSAAKVVDLTRAVEIPRPAVQQPLASQPPAGQVASGRKQHHRAIRPMPAPMMMPQQQVPSGMQHSFHRRMSASPMQNMMATQLASNYVAQLQQQVARSMSPMSPMPVRRQRPVNQCTQKTMPLPAYTSDDDDEDVVIVGTGHEEPSPSWSSPMRKRPLPSSVPSSPASLQKTRSPYQPPEKKSAVQTPPVVIEPLGSGDVAGGFELTADDIPLSVEDMIMQIAPAAPAMPKKHSAIATELPVVFTADVTGSNEADRNSETAVLSIEDSVTLAKLMQPARAVIETTIADDASKTAITAQPVSVEDTGENAAESLVYTDIASDMVSNFFE